MTLALLPNNASVQFRAAMTQSDSVLVLDEAHWDDVQSLLAADNLHNPQMAKFASGRPRNFA